MKIYRNKLYSFPDAAKRVGIKESDIAAAIKNNIIKMNQVVDRFFIRGKDIPGIARKWKEQQTRLNEKKNNGGVKQLERTPVTILRMDRGD